MIDRCKIIKGIEMSYKARILIAINYSYFRIKDFHKAGSLHYKTAIYYIERDDEKKRKIFASVDKFSNEKLSYCQNLKQHNFILIKTIKQPFINEDKTCFVSRQFPVDFLNRNFAENTTCYWQIFIDVDIIQAVDFFVQFQLVYKPYQQQTHSNQVTSHSTQVTFPPRKYFTQHSQSVSVYKGKINKPYDVFTYLPVSFDQFQSIQLITSYHAIVSQFRFFKNQQLTSILPQNSSFFSFSTKQKQLQFASFKNYLQHHTQNFLSSKLKNFFFIYRDFLFNTHVKLLQRKNHIQNFHNKDQPLFARTKPKKTDFQSQNTSQIFNPYFTKMYKTHQNLSQFQISKSIMSDIINDQLSLLTQKILSQWTQSNTFIKQNSYQIVKSHQKQYSALIQQRYKNNIFSHFVKMQNGKDFTFSCYDDSGQSHFDQAKKQNQKRLSESDVWSGQFLIQNMDLVQKQQKNIKIFEQRYKLQENQFHLKRVKTQDSVRFSWQKEQMSEDLNKNFNPDQHVIFLVHGFGASKMHMMLLKRFIEIKYKSRVIISVQNIGRTEDPIQKLGQRLAEQVKTHLIEVKENFKLSFIGHSMGGLIIRSAIPRLYKFGLNLHSYISICTPHLGYLYEPSSLTKMGLWMLSQIQNCDSLTEVQMQDQTNWRRCSLYNLAMNGSLKLFKNIAFVASSQDSYVPYESARVQKSVRLLSEMNQNQKQRVEVIKEMVNGMLRDLKEASEISRINVVFNIQETTLEALIGRLGHVKFLSDEQFIKEFVICFRRFFQ